MNADLLAMLGGAGPSSVATRRESGGKTLLTFKAGKMNTTRQPNGKYLITPDPRRGTITLSWHANSSSSSTTTGVVKLEWTDRRTRTTVDSLSIFPTDNVTYTKIDTGRPKDRVYLLQYGSDTNNMYFYWMQDKEDGNEDEDHCVKINMYAADANEAKNAADGTSGEPDGDAGEGDEESGASASRAAAARRSGGLDMSGLGGGGLDNAALMQILGGLNNNNNGGGGGGNRPSTSDSDPASVDTEGAVNPGGGSVGQVDALSNILENLGMPQPTPVVGGSDGVAPATPASGGSAGVPGTAEATAGNAATPAAPGRGGKKPGLTLSDLQGAMATLATTSPPAASQLGPPLDQVATPEAILSSGLLDDPEVKAKLISFLPDGQRSEERLMENLRSPQVAQCLKSLTGAILDGEALGSILANFQLSAEDGAEAMNQGNPIQAFLDCVLKSVEREEEGKGSGDKGDEGDNDGDAEMSG